MLQESNFTVAQLRVCKEAIEKIRMARSEQQLEPIFAKLDQYCALMDTFAAQEEGVQKFFFSDLLIPSVNFLVNYRLLPGDFALRVEAYFKRVLRFLIAQDDHIKLSEAFRGILDPTKMFYHHNLLDKGLTDYSFNSSQIVNIQPYEFSAQETVDCLKFERYTSCWSRAIVQFKGATDSHVRYLNSSNIEALLSNEREIMQFKSRTTSHYDAMLDLALNDPIDFCDCYGNWVLTKIVDIKLLDQKELAVQYKVPEDDQYICATSPRLAPPNLHSSRETPDANDLIFNDEYKNRKFWALLRAKGNKSQSFVRILNYFGQIDGFDELLRRIQNEQKRLPIEILANYLAGMGQSSAQFSRQFGDEYILPLCQTVTNQLIRSPEAYVRNMAKDKIDLIFKAMDSLLKKVYTQSQRMKWAEQTSLQVVLICFRSQFLDRKIQALKHLAEIAKAANCYNKNTSLPQLLEWIEKERIFESLFSSSSHLQLISRSTDFLKFMIATENALSNQHMELLWGLMSNKDPELKPIIYKVLNDSSLSLKDHQISFFQEKITHIPIQELDLDQMNFLFDMNRFQMKNQDLLAQAIKVFWKIAQHQPQSEMQRLMDLLSTQNNNDNSNNNINNNNNNTANDFEEKARNYLCDLLRVLESKDLKMEMISQLLANVQQQRAVSASLKTLISILYSFPSRETENDKFTLQVVLEELIEKNNLIGLLVKNIQSFREGIGAMLPPKEKYPPEFVKGYIGTLSERVQTLKQLVKMNDKKDMLSLELLNTLWREFVLQARLKEESDLMCRWLQELAEKGKDEQLGASLQEFFAANFVGEDLAAKLGSNGFECFRILMLKLNERRSLLRCLVSRSIVTILNAEGQVTAIQGGVKYDHEAQANEFQWEVDVEPDKLLGIQFLWAMVFCSEQNSVVEAAVSLMTKLHLNISIELKEQYRRIRMDLIEKVIEQVRVELQRKADDPRRFKRVILRSQLVLRELMNESELLGVGSLRSLAGLVKGELLHLSINNEITFGLDVLKKLDVSIFSNRTVMELRAEVAKQLGVQSNTVKLVRTDLFNQPREMQDTDNGKTLEEAKLRSGETLIASRRSTKPVPQVPLLTQDGKQMVPAMKRIVSEWFLEYSTDGMMSRQQVQLLAEQLTGEKCTLEDSRVKDTMDTYDHDRDDFLRLEDLEEFYLHACQQRPGVVWRNLQMNRYRNDLRKEDEIKQEELDETLLPRHMLSTHEAFFQLMFLLLDEDREVAAEVWLTLNRLPPSQAVMDRVLKLVPGDWSGIFPQKSPYRLLYSLKLIEFLLSEDAESSGQTAEHRRQEQALWRSEFVACGGFEQLAQVFRREVNVSHEQESNAINNTILSFILIIVKTYLTAALFPIIPSIYRLQQYCLQTHFSLEQITTNLSENESEAKEQKEVSGKFAEEVSNNQNNNNDKNSSIKKKPKVKVQETEEFLQLANKLQGELGRLILQSLDMLSLFNELQFLIISILSRDGEIESDHRLIIENGLCLIIQLVLYDTERCQAEFLTSLKTHQFLDLGLFTHKNVLIRKMFAHLVHVLAFQHPSVFRPFFTKLSRQMLPTDSNPARRECTQYFDVFARLIEDYPEAADQQLAEKLINLVEQTECSESCTTTANDKTFSGYLTLLGSTLRAQPSLCQGNQKLAVYLLEKCLFDVSPEVPKELSNLLTLSKDGPAVLCERLPPSYVKCKSSESRKAAFNIVVLLVRQEPILLDNVVLSLMTKVKLPVPQGFNYRPGSELKSHQGFVGLRNLGCICYMNAVLQQFFMCEAFRYAVMALRVEHKPGVHLGEEYDENPIGQLRRMFGFLEFSERADFNPRHFCFAFKDNTGNSVNVAIQQDAQEFLNMMFEKLEQGPAWWRQLVQGVFGGKLCTQLRCRSCGSLREVEELFYNLSVTVKAGNTVQDSLRHLTQGETISDYLCEACEKRTDIQRRQCLLGLPNVLIVHLQRIVFNLDTLQNEKMSNFVEFPHELSLQPFTREGLDQQETGDTSRLQEPEHYQYRLKGVVVHKGTAQYGHYYSYINHHGKWLEFNDSLIKDFDLKKMPAECFGGKDSEHNSDYWSKGDNSSTNAYMLVYEKTRKNPMAIQFASLQEKIDVLTTLTLDSVSSSEDLNATLGYDHFPRIVPADLYKAAWLDNHQFMLERHIYSEEFFQFNVSLLAAAPLDDLPTLEKLLDIELFIALEVLPRASDNASIKDFVPHLKKLISQLPHKALPLLGNFAFPDKKRLLDTMLTCPDSAARKAVCQLIVHLMNTAVSHNHFTLKISLSDPTSEKDLLSLILYFLEQLNNDVAKNCTKFEAFLELLRDFLLAQQPFAQQIQAVSILADFFLEKASPLWINQPAPSPINHNFQTKKHSMTNKFSIPDFTPLFQTIAGLVNTPLTANDLICLNYPYFFAKAIIECGDINALTKIMATVMWENEQLQQALARILIEGVEKAMSSQILNPYISVIQTYLTTVDQFQTHRIEWLLGHPQQQEVVNYSLSEPHTIFSGSSEQALLSVLYASRKIFDHQVAMLLNCLLQIANNNYQVFAYLHTMPTPSYIYQRYTDWIEPFIEQFLADASKQQQDASQSRMKLAQDLLSQWKAFQTKASEFQIDVRSYFLGQQTCSELLKQQQLAQNVTLDLIEQTHFLATSLPNGKTNLIFPDSVLYNSTYIQPLKIAPKSNIWKLIYSLKPEAYGIPAPPPLPLSSYADKLDGIKPTTEENAGINQEKKKLELRLPDIDSPRQSSNSAIEDETTAQKPPISLTHESPNPEYYVVHADVFESNFIRKYKLSNQSDHEVFISISFDLHDHQPNFR